MKDEVMDCELSFANDLRKLIKAEIKDKLSIHLNADRRKVKVELYYDGEWLSYDYDFV